MSAAWVSRSWDVELDLWTAIALSCGALCVYSLDHDVDAQRVSDRALSTLSPRRAFYVEARLILRALVTLSASLGLWASLHLTRLTLCLGLGFVILCALYLWGVRRAARLPKEAVVCAVYTVALSTPAITNTPLAHSAQSDGVIDALHGLSASLMIGALAWSNLCLISAHELTHDRAEGASSIATRRGVETARALGQRGLYVSVIMWLIWLVSRATIDDLAIDMRSQWAQWAQWSDALASALMLLTLATLYRAAKWSDLRERYRVGADLIFLYPLLTLLASSV